MKQFALCTLGAVLLSGALHAQVTPNPGPDDPRIQTLTWPLPGRARLSAFPDTSLTIILLPGERVARLEISDTGAFSVSVAQNADAFTLRPLRPDATASIEVQTTRDSYSFSLETGQSLLSAYVVRLVDQSGATQEVRQTYEPGPMIGEYRLSGDRQLRPLRVGDDGQKTFIEWGTYQPIPAVFGIGPTGDEEVVPGYMRDGRFTIDRIYPELVFRIDDEKAEARRQSPLSEP